jgi:hypothetical protein
MFDHFLPTRSGKLFWRILPLRRITKPTRQNQIAYIAIATL